jgi:hypothetical protein
LSFGKKYACVCLYLSSKCCPNVVGGYLAGLLSAEQHSSRHSTQGIKVGLVDVEPLETEIGKDYKTVYVNDTFNLDTILFDVKEVIEEISDEEMQ